MFNIRLSVSRSTLCTLHSAVFTVHTLRLCSVVVWIVRGFAFLYTRIKLYCQVYIQGLNVGFP